MQCLRIGKLHNQTQVWLWILGRGVQRNQYWNWLRRKGTGLVKEGDLKTQVGKAEQYKYPFPNIWALTLAAFEVVPLNEGQPVSI